MGAVFVSVLAAGGGYEFVAALVCVREVVGNDAVGGGGDRGVRPSNPHLSRFQIFRST